MRMQGHLANGFVTRNAVMVQVRSETSSRPIISVIMTVPQGVDTVHPTVLSILSSTLQSIELIAMIPDPDPGVRELTHTVASIDPRVRLIQAGAASRAAVRNAGAAAALGDILVFLDAGVFLDPPALSRIAACLGANPSVMAVRGRAEAVMVPDHDMRAAEVIADMGDAEEGDVLAVRRGDWYVLGSFDPGMEPRSDCAWLLRVLSLGGVVRGITMAILGWGSRTVRRDVIPSAITDTTNAAAVRA